jgi:hypothetical protein
VKVKVTRKQRRWRLRHFKGRCGEGTRVLYYISTYSISSVLSLPPHRPRHPRRRHVLYFLLLPMQVRTVECIRPVPPHPTHTTHTNTHHTYTWYVDQCLGLVCVQNAASKILHTTLTLPTRRRSCTLLVSYRVLSYRALSCLVVSRPCVLSCAPPSSLIHSYPLPILHLPQYPLLLQNSVLLLHPIRFTPPSSFLPSPSVSHPLFLLSYPCSRTTHVAGTPMSYRWYLL